MRALVVYAHPCQESYNAAMCKHVCSTLEHEGHEVKLLDLYEVGFDPVMRADERRGYHEPGSNEMPVSEHVALIKWAEMLVFVYPTWWFGLPAILKGWLDRVWIPHTTFTLPEGKGPAKGNMENISKIAVITTCGATWLVSKFVGEPGRRTILRGLKNLCCNGCKTMYLAHYKMDSSTEKSRGSFLNLVGRKLAAF